MGGFQKRELQLQSAAVPAPDLPPLPAGMEAQPAVHPSATRPLGEPIASELFQHLVDAPEAAGDRDRQAPYDPRRWREHFEEKYPGQIEASTVPPRNAKNVALAGNRHPGTGVVFGPRGFPQFDDHAVYQTRMPAELARTDDDDAHFRRASGDLAASLARGEVKKSEFSIGQQLAIEKGRTKIPHLTWHHHEESGRMMLTPSELHSKTGHVGGMDTWFTKEKKP